MGAPPPGPWIIKNLVNFKAQRVLSAPLLGQNPFLVSYSWCSGPVQSHHVKLENFKIICS